MAWDHDRIEQLCEQAQTRISTGIARTLMCRLASEIPPNDPRHLTDTRTRVSTLLEYALAYEANEILKERDTGEFISCVMWNVFPDLILRNRQGEVQAGIEVKALHTAAEEKSANLSTPLSRIRKDKDFLIIMTWGWEREEACGIYRCFPQIHSIEVFDAYRLARIRDYTWLLNQNGRIKGIDLSTPILSSETDRAAFKAEEGNMGKLMRISLSDTAPPDLDDYDALKDEADKFKLFQGRVLGLGLVEVFKEVCFGIRGRHIETNVATEYPQEAANLGHCRLESGAKFELWAGPQITRVLQNAEGDNGSAILWLGPKLNWKVFLRADDTWDQIGNGNKAENSITEIDQVLARHMPGVIQEEPST